MGAGAIASPFMTSALDEGERSASSTGPLNPGAHWTGRWVGPRAGLDAVERIQILLLAGIKSRPSSPQPAISTEFILYPSLVKTGSDQFRFKSFLLLVHFVHQHTWSMFQLILLCSTRWSDDACTFSHLQRNSVHAHGSVSGICTTLH
jgi:hypothetical protein